MEVRIRLQKIGKTTKTSDSFRIVVMSKSQSRDSKHLEILGHYDPTKKPEGLFVDEAKLQKWLDQGAQMSATVKSLVNRFRKSVKK